MEISLTSFGSSQILPLPHFSTEAARRFCSRSETPIATRSARPEHRYVTSSAGAAQGRQQQPAHFRTEGRTLTAGLGLTRGEAQQGSPWTSPATI